MEVCGAPLIYCQWRITNNFCLNIGKKSKSRTHVLKPVHEVPRKKARIKRRIQVDVVVVNDVEENEPGIIDSNH